MLSQLNDRFAIESSSFCEIWKSCISKFDFQPQTMNSKSLSISSISIFFLTDSLKWLERPKLSLRRSQSSIDHQTTESLFSSSLLPRISLHWKYKIPNSSWVLVFPTFDSECSSIQCSYVWIALHMHLMGVCVCVSVSRNAAWRFYHFPSAKLCFFFSPFPIVTHIFKCIMKRCI